MRREVGGITDDVARRNDMVTVRPSQSLAGMCLPGGIRLGAAVAAGASGTVYRGWIGSGDDEEMLVAVKVSHADDDATAMRSMREARAAAALDVPGVVHVASAGRLEDGRSWVAMEWIDGVTLEDALAGADAGAMSVAQTLRIAAQLANALAAAHDAGIVHRDLKPANVMLRRREDGELGDAVIVDFGIAKWAGEAATSASRCAGTPHYMSPEQALGEDVDARADLYALGVVMWRMLMGRVPFDGTAVEVMLAHAAQPVPAIEGVAPGVAEVIETLMAKRREERFGSAGEVALKLERLMRRSVRRLSSVNGYEATVPVATVEGVVAQRSSTSTSTSTSTRPQLDTHGGARTRAAEEDSLWVAPKATRRGWLVGVVAAAVIAGVSAFAMTRPQIGTAVAAPQPPLPPLVYPEPTAPGEPVAVVVDGGFSMRATMIGEPIAGGEMRVKLEIWDENDQPIDASQIAATIRAPGGHTMAIGVGGTNGVFELRQKTNDAGTHVLTVFAPSGETTFTVRVEVSSRPSA